MRVCKEIAGKDCEARRVVEKSSERRKEVLKGWVCMVAEEHQQGMQTQGERELNVLTVVATFSWVQGTGIYFLIMVIYSVHTSVQNAERCQSK